MDQYLDARRDTIFKQVHTLIYIFDVVSTSPTDMVYFLDILGALRAGSGPSGTPSSDASSESGSTGPMVHVLVSLLRCLSKCNDRGTLANITGIATRTVDTQDGSDQPG